jgi:hypothetical protein
LFTGVAGYDSIVQCSDEASTRQYRRQHALLKFDVK